MKIIYNKYIPVRGYTAVNIFGIVYARAEYEPISQQTRWHEAIHTRQMIELLFIGFYLWYSIEWLIRLLSCKNRKEAYRNISFEREAYTNETDEEYLNRRKRYAFIRYLKGD